jgi:hypothetical protein
MRNDCTYGQELTLAAAEKDPVKRMKHIIKFLIAGLYINPTMSTCRIPLIPILGESLQHEFPTGEKLYVEQVAYKPAVKSAFNFVGKDEEFSVYGNHEYVAYLKPPNGLGGQKKGIYSIKFKDGGKYSITDPKLIINHIIAGTKNQVYYGH